MKKPLFLGNGLNRLTPNGVSWGDLLDMLAGKPRNDLEKEIRKHKPFTLWYEEISNSIDRPSLKYKISEILDKNLEYNEFHEKIMGLKYKNILTTNYDYCLEKAQSNYWEKSSTAQETLYSLFRRNISQGTNIWHIHGELESPRSIMLGHDQYTGYSQKISNFLSIGVPTESKERQKKPYISKFSKKAQSPDTENWVDVFIEDEIHMLGFSLDYTENHLWSLISRKNKLKKNHSLGKLVFHNCSIEEPSIAEQARFSLLKSFGVDIKNYIAPTFEDSYSKCIAKLR